MTVQFWTAVSPPILCKEIEISCSVTEKGEVAGVDNIPTELV